MLDVEVIEDPAAAVVALAPMRAQLLAALAEPSSATALAGRVGLSRQKVNYHLRALEAAGLVQLAGERRWGGLTERLMVATAASYVVSPGALGKAAIDPARMTDQLSARYLIALAARVVREVGTLARRADAADKRLSTLAVDTEIRFGSAAERAAFAAELAAAVTSIAARYHDTSTPDGRSYRLLVAAHPLPHVPDPEEHHMSESPNDSGGPRTIDLETEVPGTPEQVWEAIATGPGVTAWLHHTEIEERDGGRYAFDMGNGLNDSGVVSAWEPPRRFATSGVYWEPAEGGPAAQLATEWLIEARDGGTCIVRVVMSGFGSGTAWDNELEGMTQGMREALDSLRSHLAGARN